MHLDSEECIWTGKDQWRTIKMTLVSATGSNSGKIPIMKRNRGKIPIMKKEPEDETKDHMELCNK